MSEAAAGKKRSAAPEKDDTKDLFDVEIADDVSKKLEDISRDVLRADIANERAALKRLAPVYQKRRELIKTIPKFWPVTLMNNSLFAQHCQHADDQKALIALEDLWVERDPVEDRTFTIEFYFGENPYFSDRVLMKEYKYLLPPSVKDEKPDEHGITDSMLEFSWERDVIPQKTEIAWKSDAVNLAKLYPRVKEGDDVVEPGSLFNLFQEESDPFELGVTIANEIFPEAIDLFTGKFEITDDEDSEEEDDDDEADEIDLEKPEPKKRKV